MPHSPERFSESVLSHVISQKAVSAVLGNFSGPQSNADISIRARRFMKL